MAQKNQEINDLLVDVTIKSKALEVISSKLSKYLSPQLYNSIFSGNREVHIESRRCKLTVFFSDIVGFTEITESLEAEDLTALLNEYLNAMAKIALKYGGTIDKFIGDAIMIFFGDPESHGVREDALACVSMALEMRSKIAELKAKWSVQGFQKQFDARMGINTGYCTVGNFGSNDRMDYTIIGGQVNIASRLETMAPTGGILISHETYSLIRENIYCEESGEVTLKGIFSPIRTYIVQNHYNLLSGKDRIIDIASPKDDSFSIKVNLDTLHSDNKDLLIHHLESVLFRIKNS
ncbi:MAG: adenylate/guanylate cyclase domain-containing protein [Magnetococcus sp. YQC-5]